MKFTMNITAERPYYCFSLEYGRNRKQKGLFSLLLTLCHTVVLLPPLFMLVLRLPEMFKQMQDTQGNHLAQSYK